MNAEIMRAAIEAIRESPVSQIAKMTAAPLVEYWIRRHYEEDSQLRHLLVEAPFYIKLDDRTFCVGVMDNVVWKDEVIGREWKTCKAPKKNKGGGDSAWWNEEVWTKELMEGPQVATYALALRDGYFLVNGQLLYIAAQNPKMFIRAVVKDVPPRIWPTNPENGTFQFSPGIFEYVRQAYLLKAEVVRAMRRSGRVPWQLPGRQCTSFNRVCHHHETFCTTHRHPPAEMKSLPLQPSDPASAILPFIPVDTNDPEVVVLSYSAYTSYTQCAELARLNAIEGVAREENENLEIGSAFHTGISGYLRAMSTLQVTESQQGKG